MNEQQLIALLQRIFKAGLNRIPKKQQEARALMALSLVELDVDGIFDEAEIDAHLHTWLAGINIDHGGVDHVTWRRGLVDRQFLRRATDGAIYRLRGETIDAALAPEAKSVDVVHLRSQAEEFKQARATQFGAQPR